MENRVYEAVLYSEYRSRRRKEKRIKQLRRRIFMFVLTVVLVLTMTISYGAILSEATTKDDVVYYKYYTSIEVQYGDSLWSIADEYASEQYASRKEYINEVKEINHLKEEALVAGQYLVIPYYSLEFK